MMERLVTIVLLSVVAVLGTMAQEAVDTTQTNKELDAEVNMLMRKLVKTADNAAEQLVEDGVVEAKGDSLTVKMPKQKKAKRDWASWRPDIKKAMWMSIVIPGGGQIYNRKYWKLPIVYGGFVGCAYAWRWNGQMYSDYSQAYLDISDDDPNTKSYEKFLHLGAQITPENMAHYKDVFRRRKDTYRRWRDLSTFCMIGVYLLSIIDAYVDASLSQFDINEDLSMKVSPAYLNGNGNAMTASRGSSLTNGGLGVHCQLNF